MVVADAAMEIHAALNTYEVAGTPPLAQHADPRTFVVVGANSRRLIARWNVDGVWIGGCLITDREHAEALARFITRESDGDE